MAFEGEKITAENYHSKVGTYINLILQNCLQPIICLMATKMDLALEKRKKGHIRRKPIDLSFVLDMVRNQVQFYSEIHGDIKPSQKVFLHDQVLTFSSKKPQKENLKSIADIFSAIMSNKEYVRNQPDFIPSIWDQLLKELNKNEAVMEFSDVECCFSEIKKNAEYGDIPMKNSDLSPNQDVAVKRNKSTSFTTSQGRASKREYQR